jgi:hypothetical protein
MGGARRIVAAMLALVLLALPGAAARHASASVPVPSQVAAHCVAHAGADEQAAPAHAAHGDAGPCGDSRAGPGLACCGSAQCPATIGAPPPASIWPWRMTGGAVRHAPLADGTPGIEVPPSLPPPRAMT